MQTTHGEKLDTCK